MAYEFAPIPWVCKKVYGDWSVYDSEEKLVAEIHTEDDERQTALLIAAAPDLLDALKAARPYVMTCVDEPTDLAGRALAALDAAIAKAEGQS